MSLCVSPGRMAVVISVALACGFLPLCWAELPPPASVLSRTPVTEPKPAAVKTMVSSKQKPLGPEMVLKLTSPRAQATALKPVASGSSRMAYQTRLQNPNNPYGRSTFPVEPEEDPVLEAPPAATQPAVVDDTAVSPPSQQLTSPAAPVSQKKSQPAPPVWSAQAAAAQTPAAKSPVIDPWRQAQAVPEGSTPTLTPPEQQGQPAAGQSFNLQTQKGALARTYMFRQLTPRPYKSYMVGVKALMASLHDTFVYLRDLNGELPDLQRLSAFQARVRVEWLAFQKRLPPDAQKFSSYKSIEVSVAELDAMSAYWINRNRVKRVYQGTLDQEYTDDALFQTRLSSLKNNLANLEALAQTEREVVREIPYAY